MENIIKIEKYNNVDFKTFQKMVFIYNALEDGWKVQKKKESYVFSKPHENKREILSNTFLKEFISNNLNDIKLIN